MDRSTKTLSDRSHTKQRRRRPYKRPAIVHEDALEAMAGACSESDPVHGKADAGCSIKFS